MGYSLVEVLVVIGIIASITVSTLLNARDKARQGATIADMRTFASALEAYSVDYTVPPDTAAFPDVALLLSPYQNTTVPVNDHWGHVYGYERGADGAYSLVSFGKDGADGAEITPDTLREFDRDIVVSNGRFPGLP